MTKKKVKQKPHNYTVYQILYANNVTFHTLRSEDTHNLLQNAILIYCETKVWSSMGN
jgi:hypothetical protein